MQLSITLWSCSLCSELRVFHANSIVLRGRDSTGRCRGRVPTQQTITNAPCYLLDGSPPRCPCPPIPPFPILTCGPSCSRGFLLIEDDPAAASGYTAYGAAYVTGTPAGDALVESGDDVMRLQASLYVDDDHVAKSLLCKDPVETRRQLARLCCLLARHPSLPGDPSLAEFNKQTRRQVGAVTRRRATPVGVPKCRRLWAKPCVWEVASNKDLAAFLGSTHPWRNHRFVVTQHSSRPPASAGPLSGEVERQRVEEQALEGVWYRMAWLCQGTAAATHFLRGKEKSGSGHMQNARVHCYTQRGTSKQQRKTGNKRQAVRRRIWA